MAEIILPPEEEQEETPQVPEINIDKPTENSKVITIEFEAKKTNKVSTKDTNQQLYTTDTDAWFEFKETSLEGANGTYSVVFRNRHDGSIFQRTGDVVGGVAYYKIPHQEIRHAGAWRGQIVYTLINGDTTAREFGYDVKGHILDGKDVREIVVEDFETLMSQLRSMKDNAEVELAHLTQELRNTTDTAEQNETDRQVFFDDLVEDIDELQSNYQELLDTGVLQTNINTKLEALEEEYAPKLTEVTAQLAQTKSELDVKKIDKNRGAVTPADLSQEVKEQMTGESVAVVGKNAVLEENIVDNQVSPKKTSFAEEVPGSVNLFDKEKRTNGVRFYINGGTYSRDDYAISDFIAVKPNTVYTRYYGGEIIEYTEDKTYISGVSVGVNTPVLTSDETRFIRFSVYLTTLDTYMLVEGESLPSEYVSYAPPKIKIDRLLLPEKEEDKKPFEGLSLAINGDSIANRPYFTNQLKEQLGFAEVTNYAISGSAYTVRQPPRDTDALSVRYTEMADTHDVIIVWAGTNDVSSAEVTQESFREAVQTTFQGLVNEYPTKKLAVFTMPPRFNRKGEVHEYADIILEEAGYESIPAFDVLRHSQIRPWNETNKQMYMSDGLHPNVPEGYDLILPYMIECLKTI